jgi:putrescine transport system substrate-binding protein
MKITRRHALVTMSAAAGLAMPYVRRARADAGTVNVYNWADYIGESTIADFTKETGIKVVYDMYASTEEMEAKMLAGSSGYDVVLQSGLNLPRMVTAKVYQKLDKTKLSNWGNLDPEILTILQGFDPGNEYGVPYTWGTVGFTYNMDLVKKVLPDADFNSLDTIFNPDNAQKLATCGLSILDSPNDIGPIVMKWLGIDPNKAGPDDYKKLAEAFAKISPTSPPSTTPTISPRCPMAWPRSAPQMPASSSILNTSCRSLVRPRGSTCGPFPRMRRMSTTPMPS